jgi:hypothetical protein
VRFEAIFAFDVLGQNKVPGVREFSVETSTRDMVLLMLVQEKPLSVAFAAHPH